MSPSSPPPPDPNPDLQSSVAKTKALPTPHPEPSILLGQHLHCIHASSQTVQFHPSYPPSQHLLQPEPSVGDRWGVCDGKGSGLYAALGGQPPSPSPHYSPSPYLRHSDSPRAALGAAEDSNSLPFSDSAPEAEPEWHLSPRPRPQPLFGEDQCEGEIRLGNGRAPHEGTNVERQGEA